jgi:hypothetical protein
MLEIDIIQGAQLTHVTAESVKLTVLGEGIAKILPGHMPLIALCEGYSLEIDDAPVPVTHQFLIETKNTDNRTSVTIFAPEIPDILS